MRKLTQEDIGQMGLLPGRKVTRVYAALAQLQPGEGVLIEKGVDWISARPPWHIVRYYEKKSGRRFERHRSADGNGWVVQRIS